MYILCTLDSEHYGDPEFKKFNSNCEVSDIQAYAEEDAYSYFCFEKGKRFTEGLKMEWSEDGMRLDARKDDFFVVYELKEVPDADYIIGKHHAYDGVDFEIKTAPSIEIARAIAKAEVEAFIDERGLEKSDKEDWSINQTIIDDGNEWTVWTTYLVHETHLAKQIA
jgi:hypothetical protein